MEEQVQHYFVMAAEVVVLKTYQYPYLVEEAARIHEMEVAGERRIVADLEKPAALCKPESHPPTPSEDEVEEADLDWQELHRMKHVLDQCKMSLRHPV